jgi:hypothetical protein
MSGGGSVIGVPGLVGAPGPASFGAKPLPEQTATAGGPSFDGSSGSFGSGDSFPLIVSSLQSTSDGVSAVSSSQPATVSFSTSAGYTTVRLTIPALGMDVEFWNLIPLGHSLGPGEAPTYGFSYVALGQWGYQRNSDAFSAFAFGYETPAAAMPASGSAKFSGWADAQVLKGTNTGILRAYVSGRADLTVNFTSGEIRGALTNMQEIGSTPWNDVSITASILGGSNRFSGSIAAGSELNTTFSLTGSAAGHIDGAFYGPNAENLGAVWSLSDGTTSALGTVGAAR